MLFTVFTPIYNRRTFLHRVWDSLMAQTCRDFEWIVVDDGSSDNVQELLESYPPQADFPIRVVRQPNSGKHIAWNRAVAMARGELFVPADSDDAFIPEALERFQHLWMSIDQGERAKFSGINVLCKDPETGRVVGNLFPHDRMVSQNLELAFVHKIQGEKWGCIRTDVLRERPFPEDERLKRNYVTENYLWFGIARRFQVLCVNEPLRLYYRDAGNSLSLAQITRPIADRLTRHPFGRYFFSNWNLNANLDYLKLDKRRMLATVIDVWVSGLVTGRSVIRILRDSAPGLPFMLRLAAMPVGVLAYWYCRMRSQELIPADSTKPAS